MQNKKFEEAIECPYCKYNNKVYNVKAYGTCTRCKKVLEERAKFKHDMNVKLRLWRKRI